MLRYLLSAAAVIMAIAATAWVNSARAQSCPPVDVCVSRCQAKGGPVAQKGRCQQFCQNRPCLSKGAAAQSGDGQLGAATKRGGPPPRAVAGSGKGEARSPAQPFVRAGRDLIQQGKFQAALAEFDKAVQADPRYVWGYVWRGTARNRMGQYRQGLPEYDKALEIDPRNFQALIGRASAHRGLTDYGRALADLNAAGEIEPSAGEPYAYRAMIYSIQGDQQRALKEANTAVQLNPRHFQSHGSLGLIYSAMREWDKAADAYDKSLQIQPHVFGNIYGRGVALRNLGEMDRALKDFEAALTINPNYTSALVYRSRIYTERGQLRPALADLDHALRLNAKSVHALLQRAKVHELGRNLAAAREDYAAVLVQFPAHGVAAAGVERMEARLSGKDPGASAANRTGGRVALVIGNSRYVAIDKLSNPERDARVVAEALQKVGFEKVELLLDGTRESIATKLKSFAEAAAAADWGVVYYAGHGIEVEGTNYIVPIDAKYAQDTDVPKESVALDQVLNAVGAAGKMRLVILDACRDNPFVDMKRTDEASVGKGLARIEPESGTLVAFATKHGKTASDGTGQNSPFAAALARRIQTPGLEVSQIFRLVHDEVVAETQKQQEPFTYGQLSAQQFFFKAQ